MWRLDNRDALNVGEDGENCDIADNTEEQCILLKMFRQILLNNDPIEYNSGKIVLKLPNDKAGKQEYHNKNLWIEFNYQLADWGARSEAFKITWKDSTIIDEPDTNGEEDSNGDSGDDSGDDSGNTADDGGEEDTGGTTIEALPPTYGDPPDLEYQIDHDQKLKLKMRDPWTPGYPDDVIEVRLFING